MKFQNLLGFAICAFVLMAIAYSSGSFFSGDFVSGMTGAIAGYGMYCLAAIIVGIPLGLLVMTKDAKIMFFGGLIVVCICAAMFFTPLLLGW